MQLGQLIPLNRNSAPVDQEGPFTVVDGQAVDAPSHYSNLLPTLEMSTALYEVRQLQDRVDEDVKVHEPMRRIYAKTIKNLGLNRNRNVNDSPNPGASNIADPSLLKAGQDLSARIMGQLWSDNKPVMTQVLGASTPQKMQKSERVASYMSWQLTEGIEGYYEQDDLMFQHLAFIGTAFKKNYYDGKNNASEYVSPENLVVPYEAASLRRAERITHIITMSNYEFKKLIKEQYYQDVGLQPTQIEQTSIDNENNAIIGLTPPDEPSQYKIYECNCYLDLGEGDAPYVISWDKDSRKILRISRNWQENDASKSRIDMFTNYVLIPWKGVYGLGLTHQAGNLSATASNIMNALVDSGFKASIMTGLKAHNDLEATSGSQLRLEDGKFTDIKLGPSGKIGDAIMLMPMPQPSPVMFQLWQELQQQIGSIANINSQQIADATNNGPVGTTYALISENAKMFNAIFKRIHKAKQKEFDIIYQLNARHLDDRTTIATHGGELVVSRNDFDGDLDVMPVSDPTVSSVAERVGRMAAIGELAVKFPGILDGYKVVESTLKTLGVPELESLMVKRPPDPTPRDPMGNVQAILEGMPTKAFPEQMQFADEHITFYTNILKDPAFGQNPLLVKVSPFAFSLATLLQQFVTLRTVNMYNFTAVKGQQRKAMALGVNPAMSNPNEMLVGLTAPPLPPEVEKEVLDLITDPYIVNTIKQSNELVMKVIGPILDASLAHMPPQPVDPNMVYAQAEADKVVAETKTDAAKLALEAEKMDIEQREAINKEDQANLRAIISATKALPPGIDLFSHLPADIPEEAKDIFLALQQMIASAQVQQSAPIPSVGAPQNPLASHNPPAGPANSMPKGMQ